MEYIEVNLKITPLHPYDELITVDLAALGYESFITTPTGLQSYIPQSNYAADKLAALVQQYNDTECSVSYEALVIPSQNWNASWESNFEAIDVDGKCGVRAPFHTKNPAHQYDIVIEPKMSFGTGHHETTYLMLHSLLGMELSNKSILDMGCGTSVLAILAALKSAKSVTAIDNDAWSYENSLENCKLNNCLAIEVKLGDVALIKDKMFNLILANINRNILLADMKHYVASLQKEGELLISGFFEVDAPALIEEAEKLQLHLKNKLVKNNWCLLHFQK